MSDETARGIIVRDEGSDLIIRATAAEAARFATGESVMVMRQRATGIVAMPGDSLFDAAGRRIGYIVSAAAGTDAIDVTAYGMENRVFVPGRRHVTYHVVGVFE